MTRIAERIVSLVVLVVALSVMLSKCNEVEKIKEQAQEDKIKEIDELQDRYKDSMSIKDRSIAEWSGKYDSIQRRREKVTGHAIKINKEKSNEDIKKIHSANDSTLRFISDSSLRANGFNR